MTARSPLDKAEVGASVGREEIIVQSGKEFCSKSKDDCAATKCCQVSGFSCFETVPGTHRCMEGCDKTKGKGWTCAMPREIVPLVEALPEHANWLTPQLYCWGVYTKDTGATKPSTKLALFQQQLA